MKQLNTSLRFVFVTMILCGLIFPLTVTAVGQLFLNSQANGSLVKVDGQVVGSKLIGQKWTQPEYFHGRQSSVDYNMSSTEEGVASGSHNYANSHPDLKKRVNQTIRDEGGHLTNDAVTESGSGLDPHITVLNAKRQVDRIAKERHISPQRINQLIQDHTTHHGLVDDYVNVLELNIALDQM
ncbi:K(+)-transporting ATPase subunit C [Staphylococcus felis]|uniref:K(+)-transporting ATPase subunit C n=1 Tax=Staphylococcus felis TaxID=46127 RepID=UPI003966AE07